MFYKIKALIKLFHNKPKKITLINYEGYRFSIPDNFCEVRISINKDELSNVLLKTLSDTYYLNLGYEVYNCQKYDTRELSDFLEYLYISLETLRETIECIPTVNSNNKTVLILNSSDVGQMISAYHSTSMFIENLYKFTIVSSETPVIISKIEGSGNFRYIKKSLEDILFKIRGLNIERINMYNNPELFKK